MSVTKIQRNIVLSVLFFLPVAFVIIMMLSKENYTTLDIIKTHVSELPENTNNITLENHITVLGFLGRAPLSNSTVALNLKELVYDRSKGFKKFQVVILLPKEAQPEAEQLLKAIKTYEDLRFWHFVYVSDLEIKQVFNSVMHEENLDRNLATNHVFVIDRDKSQRGRLDDRTPKQVKANAPIKSLYSYDCVEVSELKNKLAAEDMRVLFTEYRQKRKGNFDNSNNRRANDLKQ